MTGPEHYREAERLLTEAAAFQVDEADADALPYLTRAQVHATLALAAATAELEMIGNETVAATGRRASRARAWASVLTPDVATGGGPDA